MSHEHVDELNAIRLKLLKFQLDSSALFHDILDLIKSESYTPVDGCDIGWCFREIENYADELRKEAKARKELIGRLLAFRVTQDAMNDPDLLSKEGALTIRGRFCSGTPEVKQQGAQPKRGSEDYVKLCNFFGITDDALIESGTVQFSFNKLGDLVSGLMVDGKQLPPGITKTYPLYSTIFRTKKGKK